MPLTRTRRRILIAAVVVIGLLFFAWPRHKTDERFVGRWLLSNGDFFVLKSDGACVVGEGVSGFADNADWWYDDSRLFIELRPTTAMGHLRPLYDKLMGKGPWTFKISRIDEVALYVDDGPFGESFWARIPAAIH